MKTTIAKLLTSVMPKKSMSPQSLTKKNLKKRSKDLNKRHRTIPSREGELSSVLLIISHQKLSTKKSKDCLWISGRLEIFFSKCSPDSSHSEALSNSVSIKTSKIGTLRGQSLKSLRKSWVQRAKIWSTAWYKLILIIG